MDKKNLAIFKSDIQAQMELIHRIYNCLKDRADGLKSGDIIRIKSIAYQIHNLYNVVEYILEIIAAYFENNITDTAKWQTLLLQRMAQQIDKIRPALLSQKTYSLLNALRGFRHFFRHAYGTNIEYEQVKASDIGSKRLISLAPNTWVRWLTQQPDIQVQDFLSSEFQ